MVLQRSIPMYIVALSVAASFCLAAPRAHAIKEVGAMGKGIVGLGLLGGELTLAIEALAGVKHPAALIVPPLVVAAGGAVGGYFLDAWGDKEGKPEASVAMLACGMALFIPAIVITVAKLRFVGEEDLAEDVDVTVQGGSSPSTGGAQGQGEGGDDSGGGTEVESTGEGETTEGASLGTGVVKAMVEIAPGKIRIGVPPLEIVSLYSDEEMMIFASEQGIEYRLGIVNVSF